MFIFETTISKIFKFWLPVVTSKRSKLVFCTPILLEKWKSKVKGTLRWIIHLWNCSLKVLNHHGDAINPKLAWKRAPACISCTIGDGKMKIKSKGNFGVRYLFMKLFSKNLEIIATFVMSSSQNWIKKSQICISCISNRW